MTMTIDEKLAVLAKAIKQVAAEAATEWDYGGEQTVSTGITLDLGIPDALDEIIRSGRDAPGRRGNAGREGGMSIYSDPPPLPASVDRDRPERCAALMGRAASRAGYPMPIYAVAIAHSAVSIALIARVGAGRADAAMGPEVLAYIEERLRASADAIAASLREGEAK